MYKWVPKNLGKTQQRGNPVTNRHPIQGEVAIFLVASCHRNWVKGPVWPQCNFTSAQVQTATLDLLCTENVYKVANAFVLIRAIF